MISIHHKHINSTTCILSDKTYKQALNNGEILRPQNWKKIYKIDFIALVSMALVAIIVLMFFYI